jgi:hypothetical protein
MRHSLLFILGFILWIAVLTDGFVTIIQPRYVHPLRYFSGLFYRVAWQSCAWVARRLPPNQFRARALASFGPLSVVGLLALWGMLVIFAFACMYEGLGARFLHSNGQPVRFEGLLYMSGSTFLTLGLGDIVSPDFTGRLLMICEAATGLMFLSAVVSYLPTLDAAYAQREVGNLLLQSRGGISRSGIAFLHSYFSTQRDSLLPADLHDAERWFAGIHQSHVSHPIVAYYRAHRWGTSWLISFAQVMDACAILMAHDQHPSARQARFTFRTGLRLITDILTVLGIKPPHAPVTRFSPDMLPQLNQRLDRTCGLTLDPQAAGRLFRLSQIYDVPLVALANWLVIPLPPWNSDLGEVSWLDHAIEIALQSHDPDPDPDPDHHPAQGSLPPPESRDDRP